MTTVVNRAHAAYDVYIGRPSVWGNPFVVGHDGTRAEVIVKYEEWLRGNSGLVALAKKHLKGKVLGCWCSPLPCHGDVLARIAEER